MSTTSKKTFVPTLADTVRFDPTTLGLPPNWNLLDYSTLKGWACKIPQDELQQMLASLHLGDGSNVGTADGKIALDCSIRTTKQGHYVISTTDFFFPLVESPYLQGRIGAANVLSDLYATGVADCDFMLMLLAASRDMTDDDRAICTQAMVQGFREACDEAEAPITGGQTVLNPWPIIGGVATSIVTSKQDFCPTDGAQVGDVVVLTKPLGTQVAVNVHQWRQCTKPNSQNNQLWTKCIDTAGVTIEGAESMMHKAVCSMARLNRNGARLLLKYQAHACTDVTGFGILGHAQNLADNQVAKVAIDLHTLPCIAGTRAVNDQVMDFQLIKGYSAETSGGLMVCMKEDQAQAFCDELKTLDGCPSWIIGRVVESNERKCHIVDNAEILEV